MKMFKSTLRIVVLYGTNRIYLDTKEEDNLKIFERKILRTIRTDEGEMINHKIIEKIEEKNMVKMIKSQRWYPHLHRRGLVRIIKKFGNGIC